MGDAECDVGVYGLSVMGQNFAMNVSSKGYVVAVGNRSAEIEGVDRVAMTLERADREDRGSDGDSFRLKGSDSSESFVLSLKRPRKIIILVQAGNAVDETISNLSAYMEEGDVLVDGGNEWYPNSIRRAKFLEERGIHFLGMGISGGEEGARYGPSLMVGGSLDAYNLMEPILAKCAAKLSADEFCIAHIGPIGAGNYVKMVHNGIEYADMQLIAEVYHILKVSAGLTNDDLSRLFNEWNMSELESYLIEITSTIFSMKDDRNADGSYILDKIVDKAGMKGTGRWTVQDAAERNVAIPSIAAALDARYMSSKKEERVSLSGIISGPVEVPHVQRRQIVEDCRNALFAAKICCYSQGFALIKTASDQVFLSFLYFDSIDLQ